MVDVHPSTLRRILALRQFPILAGAELGELALFAENVTEVTLSAGAAVATAGAELAALHLVLDGEIATPGVSGRTWRPRQVFGALEVLAYRTASGPAVATVETKTLRLLAPDVTDVLEDSFGVMLATLRVLAGEAMARGMRARSIAVPEVRPLGLVERLLVLRQHTAFSHAPLEPLVALAHRSEDVAFPAGAVMAQAGEPGASSYVILQGTSRATHGSGATRVLGPGDAAGHLAILGSLSHDETVEAVEPVHALKIDASTLFDVIEDHTDFGRAVLAVLAGDLLDGLPAATN